MNILPPYFCFRIDVYKRQYKVLQGYHVLHPMGWDAFGLPAENFAIKHNIHPAISTAENIANVKRQLHEISAIYDWDREVNTTDPGFYKWTQWIFVQMFKKGLAYEKDVYKRQHIPLTFLCSFH